MIRPRRLAAVTVLGAALVVAGCSGPAGGGAAPEPTLSPPLGASMPEPTLSTTPAVTPSPAPRIAAPARARGVTAADALAGVLSPDVPRQGSGRLHVVPGDQAAPGKGRRVRIRVEVEGGLGVDARAFATFVLRTLNDPRSWAHDGRTFARTDGAADVRVVLASPDRSAALCRPLVTNGTLSCRNGDAAILTYYRWVKAIPGYGADRTGYRQYVVNHEVGHAVGHGHVGCPGAGRPAPVMMQQTKGLGACRPNPWPYPGAR